MTLSRPPGNLATTGIGSLPFTDAVEAAAFVLDGNLSIPFWPQLPKRSFLEGMIPQFGARLPCVEADADEARLRFDPAAKFEALEPFFTAFIEEDPERFSLPESAAAGFYAFVRQAAGRTWPVVKGQITGPITLTTGTSDADDVPLYADADLREAAVKSLVRQAEWQIARLRPLASEAVLIFVDEPVLAAYGSSTYLSITEEVVERLEGEVFDAIHGAGGISGLHVCGNCDWGTVIRTGVQVVNFDAYQFGETMALYPEAVRDLFDRGGRIAWGIVPTTTAIENETVDSLSRRLDACFDALAAKGFSVDAVRERSLLTPSCGAGSLSPENARRVFDLLQQLRDRVTVQTTEGQ